MKPIRNSVKAIIIQEGKLLCTKNRDYLGDFYLLPGGGQEPGENLHEALKRECMEEISARIEIHDILFIREYIGRNHEFAEWDAEMHQIEYMFGCSIISDIAELGNGSVPDNAQIGFEWLEIARLGEYRIYPSVLKDVLCGNGKNTEIVYLGDVN